MGETTAIEWCHHTFNPWIGCTKVHAGCTQCYAETQNARWSYNGGTWGKGAPRKVTADANWRKPLQWARAAAKAGERRRVFCASLADVLDEEAPPDAQARLWDLIRETTIMEDPRRLGEILPGGLTWLLLTKRPERWELIPEDVRPLVWLGTSISDQATADKWVPRLLAAEGFALRFLSVEPLLGPVDLSPVMGGPYVGLPGDVIHESYNFGIDWVIVGGESGPKARPCDVAWIRSIVEQCRAAGTPCFVKQLGARPLWDTPAQESAWRNGHNQKGGDPSEWPPALRVREFPEVRP